LFLPIVMTACMTMHNNLHIAAVFCLIDVRNQECQV
jgi:hypothetical protein